MNAGASATVSVVVTPASLGSATATGQVSSGVTDPSPANNSASTSIQVIATCSPRPNVGLQTTQIGPGQIRGTLTASNTGLLPGNTLTQLVVTGTSNATVTVNGVAASAGQTINLPTGTTSVQVVVTRVTAGAFTARLSVTDGCGAWPTLIGGGSGVS